MFFVDRYLGQRTIYTLKPEDCYDYALKLEEGVVEKYATKVSVHISANIVKLSYLQSTPPLAKRRTKTRKSSSNRPTSDLICQSSVDDDKYNIKALSFDDATLSVTDSHSSNLQYSSHNFLNLGTLRERSSTFSGRPTSKNTNHQFSEVPRPEGILLHEIAYCVTVPSKPRLFLLTSKGKEGLTCRVFLFSSREKAQLLKLRLAQQFQQAFTEWQARMARRASRRRSTVCERQISSCSSHSESTVPSPTDFYEQTAAKAQQLAALVERSNFQICRQQAAPLAMNTSGSKGGSDGASQSGSDEDSFSEGEDRDMHREFKRRASCLTNPERLLVGDEVERLQLHFNQVLSRNSASSDVFTSTDDDD